MNTGNSVKDIDPRCAATDQDTGMLSPQDHDPAGPVRDIQEIVDKLAAVNQQLRKPGRG